MPRLLKVTLIWLLAACVVVALAAGAVALLLDPSDYRPRFEAAASERLGMPVAVHGDLRLGFGPGIQIRVRDVEVRNRGERVAWLPSARLGVRWRPLMRGQVHVRHLTLTAPELTIVRDRDGRLNVVPPAVDDRIGPPDLAELFVAVRAGTISYRDARSGNAYTARGVELTLEPLRVHERTGARLLQRLSLALDAAIEEFSAPAFRASDTVLALSGERGIYDLHLRQSTLFGGRVRGEARAEFSAADARHRFRVDVEEFELEQFLAAALGAGDPIARGSMNFAADLASEGDSAEALLQALRGRAWLRGAVLELEGVDIDHELSRYESLIGFDLVDLGALFFAGPAGVVVMRGFDALPLFGGGRDGETRIRELVSVWDVERGVADARDVAMATDENRIAMRGRLDLVTRRFDDVTVAVIDGEGCAVMEQRVEGSFDDPEVAEPTLIEMLAEAAFELLTEAFELLAGRDCEVFYDGALPHPE
jgi:uncharacterized protein YhdP